jgi:hypothetical protein
MNTRQAPHDLIDYFLRMHYHFQDIRIIYNQRSQMDSGSDSDREEGEVQEESQVVEEPSNGSDADEEPEEKDEQLKAPIRHTLEDVLAKAVLCEASVIRLQEKLATPEAARLVWDAICVGPTRSTIRTVVSVMNGVFQDQSISMRVQEDCLALSDGSKPRRKTSNYFILILTSVWFSIFDTLKADPVFVGNEYRLETMWEALSIILSISKGSCHADLFLLKALFVAFKMDFPNGFPLLFTFWTKKHLFHPGSSSYLHFLSDLKKLNPVCELSGKPEPIVSGMRDILAEWTEALVYPSDTSSAVKSHTSRALSNKMEKPIQIDYGIVVAALSDSEYHPTITRRVIELQLRTGCRMCETVAPTITWEEVDASTRKEPHRYIKQTGRGKARTDDEHNDVRIIPLLGDKTAKEVLAFRAQLVTDVIKGLASKEDVSPVDVRAWEQKKFTKSFNNSYQTKVGKDVRALFPGVAAHCKDNETRLGSHFLRALWVNMHWENEKDVPGRPARAQFMARFLGHKGEGMEETLYYDTVHIVRPIELAPRPKKRAPPKRKAVSAADEGETKKKPKSAMKKTKQLVKFAPMDDGETTTSDQEEAEDIEDFEPPPVLRQKALKSAPKNKCKFKAMDSGKDVTLKFDLLAEGEGSFDYACKRMQQMMENDVPPTIENFSKFNVNVKNASTAIKDLLRAEYTTLCRKLQKENYGLLW